MKRASTILLTAGLLLAIAGCAPMKNFDRDLPLDASAGDSVVVIGVEPRFRIGVQNGWVTKAGFHVSKEKYVTFAFPDDGYLVFRVRPKGTGEHYAIVRVLPEGIGGPAFVPCDATESAAFEIKPGQVVYVGDIRYAGTKDALRPRYSFDVASAQQYIDRNYPRLKGPVATSRFEIMRVWYLSCSP